ncbi:MAG: hypothetical protein RL190_1565 [Actinomycetota bacterium]|jgi:hypothetical protein
MSYVDTAEFEARAARAARIEDAFTWPTTIAALACLPAFLAPVVSSDSAVKHLAHWVDWVIWGVFAVEMVVMLIITPDRRAFLRYHRLMAFILFAAFPGFAIVFAQVRLDGLTPALLLVQKLLKLAKVDRLIRKREVHVRVPGGRWLLVAPAIVADVLVWQKLGPATAITLGFALVLALIGRGRRPDPAELARLREQVVEAGRGGWRSRRA